MRYSLYSRFRGVLLGAVIGEIIGTQQLCYLDSQIHSSATAQLPVQLGRLLGQSLLHYGRFDLADWQRIWQHYYQQLQLSSTADKAQICPHSVNLEIFTATLLVALFYHDNEIKLQKNLQLALTATEQDTPANRDSALAIGYAIAQSLQERLNPDAKQLIAQTIAFIGVQSQLAQQLVQVQTMLEQGAGLERVVAELRGNTHSCTSIALAFYCYLSTAEDFRLSVQRAAQLGEQTTICSAITGALSGAYNSLAGIPATWRLPFFDYHQPLATWGVTTAAEMLQLADSLAVVWSGVYDQTEHQTEPMPIAAIAAPAVIRSR